MVFWIRWGQAIYIIRNVPNINCLYPSTNEVILVFFIPGTDSKIFQGARRVFTFHIEIFSLLSEPTANSVMKRSKCEKWKLFKPLEKFKRKGLGWVICFLRLIEVYLYAIIISTYQEKLTVSWKWDPRPKIPENRLAPTNSFPFFKTAFWICCISLSRCIFSMTIYLLILIQRGKIFLWFSKPFKAYCVDHLYSMLVLISWDSTVPHSFELLMQI